MKIAVLVSGGVDSSVALNLLKQEGHDVTAFYLKIWLEDELAYLGDCPWQEDLAYVQEVCAQLEVPLEVISLQREYWDRVVSYTINEVKRGRTPNPDVMCNQQVKFGAFLDKIDASYDMVATGHYAQIAHEDGRVILRRAPDLIKDQTYFLAHMSKDQLLRALFPIGHLRKEEVREHAHAMNLPNKDRKDSQGICFLGKLKFSDFLKHHLGEQQGDMIEIETGLHMGTHQGFWYYTIGQRQGLGLSGGPWYVAAKDVDKNIVYISRNYYAKDMVRNSLVIAECNWIDAAPQDGSYLVKLRHGAHMHHADIKALGDDSFFITLNERDQGIAPGQFVAVYNEQICLGSGIIQHQSI